jgi:hypothetical protein
MVVYTENGGFIWWKHDGEKGGLAEMFDTAKRYGSAELADFPTFPVKAASTPAAEKSIRGALLMVAYATKHFGEEAIIGAGITSKKRVYTEEEKEEWKKKKKERQEGGSGGVTGVAALAASKREDFSEWMGKRIEERIGDSETKNKKTLRLGITLWSNAERISSSKTPLVADYLLETRKLPDLSIASKTMRFSKQFNYENGFMPALVAPIWYEGRLLGVQGIFMNSGTATKASVSDSKHTLGVALAFATINDPGEDEKSEGLPCDARVLIGEGPETMLSVAHAFPRVRCYASLSIKNLCYFPHTVQPNDFEEMPLVVCADSDLQEELSHHLTVLTKRGFKVFVARSGDFKDFNEMLKAQPGEIGLANIRRAVRDAELFVVDS